jgi:hypothetical protein
MAFCAGSTFAQPRTTEGYTRFAEATPMTPYDPIAHVCDRIIPTMANRNMEARR